MIFFVIIDGIHIKEELPDIYTPYLSIRAQLARMLRNMLAYVGGFVGANCNTSALQ
jgi:hypothetical protein